MLIGRALGRARGAVRLVRAETRVYGIGMINGRAGYAFDRIMPYLSAGVAIDNMAMDNSVRNVTSQVTGVGFAIGTGVEIAVREYLRATIEYQFVDFGEVSCSISCNPSSSTAVRFGASIVKFGFSYKVW